MAAQVFGGKITVTGTATTLTTLLGLPAKKFTADLVIRADASNGGTIWFGKSGVTTGTNQLGYILSTEAFSIPMPNAFYHTDELYFIASVPGDIAYVIGVG